MSKTALKCPLGHEGPFMYAEDITVDRVVRGFNEDGVLIINGLVESAYDDCATNQRFVCQHDHCTKEFPVPEGIDIDFE